MVCKTAALAIKAAMLKPTGNCKWTQKNALQTRQIVDVGEIKGIVHKVLQSTPTTLPPNFNSIVERITREKIDDLHEQTSRTVGGEVEEEKVKTQEYKEQHVVQQEERRETLSFDDQHTDGVSVSGSIQRLAKQL